MATSSSPYICTPPNDNVYGVEGDTSLVLQADGTSLAQSFRDEQAEDRSSSDVSTSAPSTGVPSVPSRVNNLREEEWSSMKLSPVQGSSK